MTIRHADRKDASALFRLVGQFPTPTPCPQDIFERLLEPKLREPSACVLVAEAANSLVGYASGSARTAFYVGGMTAWVDEIYVVPDLRMQGIGALLMNGFETWAGQLGCRSVALATRAAAPFYEHLGYTSSAAYLKKYLNPLAATVPPSDSRA